MCHNHLNLINVNQETEVNMTLGNTNTLLYTKLIVYRHLLNERKVYVILLPQLKVYVNGSFIGPSIRSERVTSY